LKEMTDRPLTTTTIDSFGEAQEAAGASRAVRVTTFRAMSLERGLQD
jgi:hypothetical protein